MSAADNEEYLPEGTVVVRRRVSVVWRYFEKLDRFRVRCKLCRHEQNYQGTTGNILRHLKNKHKIDATVKGQKENPQIVEAQVIGKTESERDYQDDGKEFSDVRVKREKSSVHITRAPRHAKSKVESYCEEDPYTDASILDNYVETETYETHTAEKNANEFRSANAGKRKDTAEEEKVRAEIEYFREKAAYYRMQKNLTALQAKKIKYELEQLS